MFREGEIVVHIALDRGRIGRVDVASTRRPLPAALVNGRTPDEVQRALPLLYSICRQAQGAASAAALDAAAGRPTDAPDDRAAAVNQEAIVELLSRLLLDWPRALGEAPDLRSVAQARQAPPHALALLRRLAEETVYGEPVEAWLQRGTPTAWIEARTTLPARVLGILQAQAAGLGATAVAPLPADARWLDAVPPLADAGFAQAPMLDGAPACTGPLARAAGHPLLRAHIAAHGGDVAAHCLAQLVELAERLRAAPAIASRRLADGSGAGVAMTARGPLLHQADVRDGRISAYRIVAPTEWNFHPQGVLPRALTGRPADAASAARDARLLAQALDPCVACTVEVADA